MVHAIRAVASFFPSSAGSAFEWEFTTMAQAWRLPWGRLDGPSWFKPDPLVHLARELERAAFDYVMIEGSSNIP
jgi:hypothetical protein